MRDMTASVVSLVVWKGDGEAKSPPMVDCGFVVVGVVVVLLLVVPKLFHDGRVWLVLLLPIDLDDADWTMMGGEWFCMRGVTDNEASLFLGVDFLDARASIMVMMTFCVDFFNVMMRPM